MNPPYFVGQHPSHSAGENHLLTRYMMMRRYVDASRTFQDILVFLSKISAVNSLSYQYDQMLKKQDQEKKHGSQGEASQVDD